ncbi:hypothetical protein J7L09_01600, partial [bacterium]|nr:hypothetical protein [bacterium]
MSIEIFILILSSLVNVFLASLIYFKNPKSKTNIFFSGSVLMLVLWNISVIFAQETQEHIIWVKNAYFFSTFALLLFLYFLRYFPSPTLPFNKFLFRLLVISAGIFLILIHFSRFLIKLDPSIAHIEGMDRSLVFGPGLTFYLCYLVFYILFVVHSFFAKYKKANSLQKSQIRFTATGIILFIFLAVLTNLFIPHFLKIQLGNIGPAFSFIMVGFIGYAIGRYKLFELKIILTEILIGVIATILLIQAAIAETLFWQIIGFIVLFIFIALGYSLIKSINKEILYREKLQKAYDALQKLDKAKSEFISIASHQLRTPLTAIKGYASMLLEGSYGKIPNKAQKPLENICKTNEQLINLANNLLNISRIESGKISLDVQKFSIEKLLKEIIAQLKIEADKKGLY